MEDIVMSRIEPFSCEVVRVDGRVVVAPRGELDMATVGAVEVALKQAREGGAERILLDLGGLSFLDSSGLHLTVRWSRQADEDGFEFRLAPGTPAVQRAFALSQLEAVLPFEPAEIEVD
jgi:anti-anti-sigma factor